MSPRARPGYADQAPCWVLWVSGPRLKIVLAWRLIQDRLEYRVAVSGLPAHSSGTLIVRRWRADRGWIEVEALFPYWRLASR